MSDNSWSSWTTRATAFAVVIALFVAGAVTGAAVYRWAAMDAHTVAPGPLPRGPWEMLAPLELSAEQQRQVRAVYERRKPDLDQVLRDAMPKLRQVQESIDAEVARLLTDKQRTQFQTLRRHHGPPAHMPPMGFPGPPGLFPLDDHQGVSHDGPMGWVPGESTVAPGPPASALPAASASPDASHR
ncbi:MAG TPA: hypothetical protein VIV60_01460 [Polyangiaceae bacterium]